MSKCNLNGCYMCCCRLTFASIGEAAECKICIVEMNVNVSRNTLVRRRRRQRVSVIMTDDDDGDYFEEADCSCGTPRMLLLQGLDDVGSFLRSFLPRVGWIDMRTNTLILLLIIYEYNCALVCALLEMLLMCTILIHYPISTVDSSRI